MKRIYRKAERKGFKFCNRCDKEMVANIENFVKDSSRKDSLSYECRKCHSTRRKGRDRRKERWSNMSRKQKDKKLATAKRYRETPKGRAICLLKAYKRTDDCDFTSDELMDFLDAPCTHCGSDKEKNGLDRIDNNLPHLKNNVVVSCAPCNFARGDRFTFEEMKIIGKAIKGVMNRRKKAIENGGRQ